MMRMQEHQVDEVREIFALCHPTWPTRTAWWYRCMNIEVIELRRRVVAWAAMAITPPPGAERLPPDALCALLIDTCVHPEHRGQGYAGLLMDRRLDIAYLAGAQMAFGASRRDNQPMVALLDSRGFTVVPAVTNKYPDGTTGDVYIKHLGGHRVSSF